MNPNMATESRDSRDVLATDTTMVALNEHEQRLVEGFRWLMTVLATMQPDVDAMEHEAVEGIIAGMELTAEARIDFLRKEGAAARASTGSDRLAVCERAFGEECETEVARLDRVFINRMGRRPNGMPVAGNTIDDDITAMFEFTEMTPEELATVETDKAVLDIRQKRGATNAGN